MDVRVKKPNLFRIIHTEISKMMLKQRHYVVTRTSISA
jgi:hypothetical protein